MPRPSIAELEAEKLARVFTPISAQCQGGSFFLIHLAQWLNQTSTVTDKAAPTCRDLADSPFGAGH